MCKNCSKAAGQVSASGLNYNGEDFILVCFCYVFMLGILIILCETFYHMPNCFYISISVLRVIQLHSAFAGTVWLSTVIPPHLFQ